MSSRAIAEAYIAAARIQIEPPNTAKRREAPAAAARGGEVSSRLQKGSLAFYRYRTWQKKIPAP